MAIARKTVKRSPLGKRGTVAKLKPLGKVLNSAQKQLAKIRKGSKKAVKKQGTASGRDGARRQMFSKRRPKATTKKRGSTVSRIAKLAGRSTKG